LKTSEAPDITLVLPFYNPGPGIVAHVRELLEVLAASGLRYQVIAVDDGSTDGSREALASSFPSGLELIGWSRNRGKGAALRAGFNAARGRYVGFMDADGDILASCLPPFLEAVQRGAATVIVGSKFAEGSSIKGPLLRKGLSRVFALAARRMFSLPVADLQTGLKVFHADLLRDHLPKVREEGYLIDVELLFYLSRDPRATFLELPVVISKKAQTTVSAKRLARLVVELASLYGRLRPAKTAPARTRSPAPEDSPAPSA
jgi:glycosyltransferase involved in cell wall biosynthesis